MRELGYRPLPLMSERKNSGRRSPSGHSHHIWTDLGCVALEKPFLLILAVLVRELVRAFLLNRGEEMWSDRVFQ